MFRLPRQRVVGSPLFSPSVPSFPPCFKGFSSFASTPPSVWSEATSSYLRSPRGRLARRAASIKRRELSAQGQSSLAVWSEATRSIGYNNFLAIIQSFGVQTGSTGGVLMKASFKAMWLLAGLGIVMLLAAGCNDTLRQFIVPVPPPTGDPGTLAHAITLSTNPVPSSDGSDLHIDVSGDTNVGIVTVGPNPVFLGTTSNQAFVINSGDATTPPTVSVYIALNPQAATVNTVTLATTGPDAVKTPIAGSTSSANNIYIANRDSNNVSVISTGVLAVTTTIPLPAGDSQPVMIAGNGSNNKIFVVNQGSGNVTEISTIDNTVIKDITVGSSPVWAVMSTDGLFVFVVNQGDGTVSVIDTSLEIVLPCAGPFCVGGNAIRVGASAASAPNFAFYAPKLKRVYVSNTGENTVDRKSVV